MKLWLDDARPAPAGYIWARNYLDAVRIVRRAIGSEVLEAFSIDHDLGSGPTGYDFIDYIAGRGYWPNEITIHTDNPVGRDNIERVIRHSKLYERDYKRRNTWVKL